MPNIILMYYAHYVYYAQYHNNMLFYFVSLDPRSCMTRIILSVDNKLWLGLGSKSQPIRCQLYDRKT